MHTHTRARTHTHTHTQHLGGPSQSPTRLIVSKFPTLILRQKCHDDARSRPIPHLAFECRARDREENVTHDDVAFIFKRYAFCTRLRDPPPPEPEVCACVRVWSRVGASRW